MDSGTFGTLISNLNFKIQKEKKHQTNQYSKNCIAVPSGFLKTINRILFKLVLLQTIILNLEFWILDFSKEFPMPYVNIKITKNGATAEQKETLIEGVTDLLVKVLGKNPGTTVVVIDEVDTDNWGIGGESVTNRRKNKY